ncbi:MAG: glycine betaine/L-proline ABC transporter substrate-binding protein ProX [Symploca sp. SIO2B6]|nr:glycine betaine/L-proline ABC transporter substrate-binding protein ProX [Symploca sp. SIO2B6]
MLLAAGMAGCQTSETDTNTSGGTDATGGLPGTGVSVTPGYIVLEERFQTEIVNIGLEKMGYTIGDQKELEAGPLHIELGNGDVDFATAHWENIHREFFEASGGDEAMERVGIIIENALQGYLIDKATADEYNITNIEQLTDPTIAALFDTDRDGKANLTGCTTGWGCELVIEHHLDAYGLRDTVQHDQGKYFALIADTITRAKQDEPVLYYTWTPLWLGGVLVPDQDVVWLEVPFTDLPEAQGEVSEADTTANGKNLGFAVEQIYVIANQNFVDNNPAATKFMSLVQLPINDISAQNQLMQEGEDSVEDIRAHAEDWVAKNQVTFDDWVKQAIAVQ